MAASSWTVQGFIAGILGTLQSLAFIAMNIIPCLYYFEAIDNEDSLGKFFNVRFIDGFKVGLRAMLASQTAMNIIWFLSSVTLIIGNYTKVACAVRQWVIVTTIVIITSLICCCYYLAQAIPAIYNVNNHATNGSANGTTASFYAPQTATEIAWKDNSKEFSYLLLALSNGTIALWILNIILAALVHSRAARIALQAKVKPGFGMTAFGNNQTHTKVPDSPTVDGEQPFKNDEERKAYLRKLQKPHLDPVPYRRTESPVAERSPVLPNRYDQFDRDEEDERPVPLPHLGRSPYSERQDPQYHDAFGSPPNLDDSGASDSNFVFKRKSLYTYENNPAEIANRMAKLDPVNGIRRNDQTRPMTNAERIESLRHEEPARLERHDSSRRQEQTRLERHDSSRRQEPLSSRVERNESMNRVSRLNPLIYHPTAFEPLGRHSISQPVHPPLARATGAGRYYSGNLSGDEQIRESQRQLKPTPERRGYHSDHESDSRSSSPRNVPNGQPDRMPRYDNPAFDPRDPDGLNLSRYPRHQEYQGNPGRGYAPQDSFPNRRPEYDNRGYDNFREEGYDGQGYNRGPRRY